MNQNNKMQKSKDVENIRILKLKNGLKRTILKSECNSYEKKLYFYNAIRSENGK